jgi:hypothetical protein
MTRFGHYQNSGSYCLSDNYAAAMHLHCSWCIAVLIIIIYQLLLLTGLNCNVLIYRVQILFKHYICP